METYVAAISTVISIILCLRVLWLERQLENASRAIFAMAIGKADIIFDDGFIQIKPKGE